MLIKYLLLLQLLEKVVNIITFYKLFGEKSFKYYFNILDI